MGKIDKIIKDIASRSYKGNPWYEDFQKYFSEHEDNLIMYLIADTKLTGLPVNVYLDESGSYKILKHPLWIYFVNGDGKCLPLTVSDNPDIPVKDYEIFITYDELISLKSFVVTHKNSIKQFADGNLDSFEMADILRYSKQNYMVAESTNLLLEMGKLKSETTGLPVDI